MHSSTVSSFTTGKVMHVQPILSGNLGLLCTAIQISASRGTAARRQQYMQIGNCRTVLHCNEQAIIHKLQAHLWQATC